MQSESEKPKQITTNQHIISKTVLRRFMNKVSGRVHVCDLRSGEKKFLGPDGPPFTTNRSWDQRSESGNFVAAIERNFGIIAKKVTEKNATNLDADANLTITRMHCIWRLRFRFATHPIRDHFVGFPVSTVSPEFMDQGEHHGIISTLPDGHIPGRMIAGPLMSLRLFDLESQLQGTKWGIIRARTGEFILPDSYGDYLIMPLSPTCCFIANEEDAYATEQGVAEINTVAIEKSQYYFAARDLIACPYYKNKSI
ncbi:hypothetical protein [Delftia acidovorans]